jgi:hypothetical protein
MSDALSPRARAFLQSAQHDDDPTNADCERVHARLHAQLAASVAAGGAALALAKKGAAPTTEAAAPATGAATAGTGSVLMGKIGAAIAVAGVVAGGATAVTHHMHRAERAPVAIPVNATPRIGVPAIATPTPASAEAPARTASAGERAASPSAPPAEPRRDLLAVPGKHRSGAVRPRATSPAPGERPSALDAEIALLRAARSAAQSGDPARALVILREHDMRFPDGALGEDCAAERIFTLCALGQADDARSLATAFVAAHPRSPHAPAVRSSCGLASRP